MNPKNFRVILSRELGNLKKELEAYPNEESLWELLPNTSNPGGALAVHLLGNLQHYIGVALGKTDYQREKAAEFATRHRPLSDIMEELTEIQAMLKPTLDSQSEAQMQGNFPLEVEGKTYPMDLFLCHLLAHFSYHLGQINYHRRIVSGDTSD